MFNNTASQVDRRLASLEKHLKSENPVLLQVVQSFRDLDRIAYRMGILERSESFATRVPWWPMVSILGTFSSGKSTFINSFLGQKLQRTGNQAVDDKFTVICYSKEEKVRTLPGLALDADPRFPFYQISQEIDKVHEGEGQRIDAYLQLKTCLTEKLRGKILIDSPGFDADQQRNSTLRITDHMMDLSDLVLVFFDARHPEPGAMKDTLDHLVKNTITRADSNKFLFILNQIDCTSQDDNLEDVVAAWQRALSQSGLTAGRFFQIYNLDSANLFRDETVQARYETKRLEDMVEIEERIHRVEVERAYRIIGVLETTAKTLASEVAPRLKEMIQRWRTRTLALDAGLFGAMALAAVFQIMSRGDAFLIKVLDTGLWKSGLWWQSFTVDLAVVMGLLLVLSLHHMIRKTVAKGVMKKMLKENLSKELTDYLTRGFSWNTRALRSVFQTRPSGWGGLAQRRLQKVLKETDRYVQNLNDQFTNPSGRLDAPNPKIQLDVSE